MVAEMRAKNIASVLGELVSETSYEKLPTAVRHAIKLRILDQLGVALAGYSIATADPLLAILERTGNSTYWGVGGHGSLRDAALFNAFISHACYMEDGSRYTGGHPSCVVIPPAFVLAESLRATGMQFITAVAVGYEVFLRLGRAMYPSIVKRGFQSTSVLGGVSAAAACSSLLTLPATMAANAIALGSMTAVGFKEAIKSAATQPFQVGRAAEGGLTAALLARAGCEGALEILEKGFLTGFADEISLDVIFDRIGQHFSVEETYLKRHGGCRGNHAPIDMVESLIRQSELSPEEIDRIEIVVDTITFKEDIKSPVDGRQAQQSISFSVAASLTFGDASFRCYTDENLNLPIVKSLMSRIHVTSDPILDAEFPEKRPALATLFFRNGQNLTARVDFAKGEAENPMSESEIYKKFRSLTENIVGERKAERIINLVQTLEKLDNLKELSFLLIGSN